MSVFAVRLLRLGQDLGTFLSILSLNVFVVLVILKLDTTGLLATVSWLAVCAPFAVSILSGLLASGLHKLELHSEEFKPLLSKASHNDFRSLVFLADRMTPSSIARFYEADIFMRLLIGLCLAFLTVVGVFVQYNECKCPTVAKRLIQALIAIYGVRALLQYFNISFCYSRFLQIVTAVSSYHDVPNARRLADIAKWHAAAWTNFQACSSFLRTFGAVASVILAVLSTYEVQNDTCMSECPDLFTQSQHFLFAVYICEVADVTRKLVFNWYASSVNVKQLLERARSYSTYYNTASENFTNKPA